MRVLFVENQDSFSWNVIDRLPFARRDVELVSGHEVSRVIDAMTSVQAMVVGPGPADPMRAGIISIVQEAAALCLPTLGICLGHQAIGVAFGAELVRHVPCHGKRSEVRFSGSRFFREYRNETVMRYHSLALTSVRSPLRVTAKTTDGVVMAIEHEYLPIAGLQFHPDSYGTPLGYDMMASFFGRLA